MKKTFPSPILYLRSSIVCFTFYQTEAKLVKERMYTKLCLVDQILPHALLILRNRSTVCGFFYKTDVLRNFAKFTKTPVLSMLLIEL